MRRFDCPQCEWGTVRVSYESADIYGKEALRCQCARCGAWWEEKTSKQMKEEKEREFRSNLSDKLKKACEPI